LSLVSHISNIWKIYQLVRFVDRVGCDTSLTPGWLILTGSLRVAWFKQ